MSTFYLPKHKEQQHVQQDVLQHCESLQVAVVAETVAVAVAVAGLQDPC